jgi:hypothetical protein
MKMARAFLASIPLALVLVAAVIVPVAVTPGSFGFHGWPEPPQELAREAPVVVQVAEQPAPAPRRDSENSKSSAATGRPVLVASAPEAPARKPRRRPAPAAPGAQTPTGSPAPATPAAPEQVAQLPGVPPVRDVVPAVPAAAPPVFQARSEAASDDAEDGRRKHGGKRGHGLRRQAGAKWSRGHKNRREGR